MDSTGKNKLISLIGNATTNDLWSALSKASGQDVHSFMVSKGPNKTYTKEKINI
jgi:hypothetical protein